MVKIEPITNPMIEKKVFVSCFFNKYPINLDIEKKPITKPLINGNKIRALLKTFWKCKISLNTSSIGEYKPKIIIIIEPEIPGTTKAQADKKPPKIKYKMIGKVSLLKEILMFVTIKHKQIIKAIENKPSTTPRGFSLPCTFLYICGIIWII